MREKWLDEYSPGLVTPTLPSVEGGSILGTFMKSPPLRKHPNLKVRRVYADFETSRDKARWHDTKRSGSWPVYGGEGFNVWEPDTETYYGWTDGEEILEAAQARRLASPKGAPYSETELQWRRDPRTHPILNPRIAFRDVTNRTNNRTLVVALIPGHRVTTQTAPWVLWLRSGTHQVEEAFLLGILSSLVCDWWVRRFVEGHVDQEAFDCIRIPAFSPEAAACTRAIALAGRLACPDRRFAKWAKAVGVDCGKLADDEKEDMIRELDAVVALLYGLTEPQLRHIFETFHVGWAHEEPLRATLRHFHAWRGRD